MNMLQHESSPYLIQHANNPVYWKPWNQVFLEQATTENKLLIVSIGYSACHWCHVMEHDCFEDDEVAEVMNAHYISIKVDREERPDVDAVYMKALQLMTGQGGWPLNVVALPDGRPIWGGTYVRKADWISVLSQLNTLWIQQPATLFDYADQLQQGLVQLSLAPQKTDETDTAIAQKLDLWIAQWKRSFDPENGGMNQAPKFMMPANYRFLQRYAHDNQDGELMNHVDLTLDRMAMGGLFDVLGGGFSRYSVDPRWHIPHFEKMAYDNGQLLSLYAAAFKRTQKPLYREIIDKTAQFMLAEWQHPEGGFYSALDADSLNNEGQSEEGAYYVWTPEELKILLKDQYPLFAEYYSINATGHWEHGRYVLFQLEHAADFALKHHIALADFKLMQSNWEHTLLQARAQRPQPGLDDKILCSWNAIVLIGLADAYMATGNQDYFSAAQKNAHFIRRHLTDAEGRLHRSWKNGQASLDAYLEDYAWVCKAWLKMYELTLDEQWVYEAKQWADLVLDDFYDAASGFFAFTSRSSDPLIAPHFEWEDNVIPSSNAVMAEVLLHVGRLLENTHYSKIANNMLQHVLSQIDYPSAYSYWLYLAHHTAQTPSELVVCGPDALAKMEPIWQGYYPQLLLAGATAPSKMPLLQHRFDEHQTRYFLCYDHHCDAPTQNWDEVLQKLK
ncbi:MAG: thioredoxin domain-containing protein [Flavobacterium sp. BFFFF2]|nr:MAG: thioredoxin domain-containing protein [Flavobacterium sp. BFFFF2]